MAMSPREVEEDVHCITIPVRGAEQTVEVYTDDLPRDHNDVVDVLKAEIAPLDIWLRFAVEYYRQGMQNHFRSILNEIIGALNPETEGFYSDDPKGFETGRLRILNALAADAVKRATASSGIMREQCYTEALSHLTSADRIDNMSELTWVGKGVFYLSQGELERAKYFFENARKKRKNVPATLGEAAVCFHRNDYEQALRLYSEALRLNPGCSASVRVGLGMCCYRLGQVERAKAAFKRAQALDPSNVEASVGRAIVELSMVDADSPDAAVKVESAMSLISMAHHREPRNAMALNHLANHYFWTWKDLKTTITVEQGSTIATSGMSLRDDLSGGALIRIGSGYQTALDPHEDFDGTELHLREPYSGPGGSNLKLYKKDTDKVLELANKAFNYTSVPEVKAESLYLRARVHHALGDFANAKLMYEEACQFWPEFVPAQYGMAQMLVHEGRVDDAVAALSSVLKAVPDNPEALLFLGMLYAKKKMRQEALDNFKQALDLNPDLTDALIVQAQVLQQDPASYEQALLSYSKALGAPNMSALHRADNGTSDQATNQSAWTNVALLHEHVGDPQKALHAYQRALESKRQGDNQDSADAEVRLRITDPANQLFWAWKELPGTATIRPGECIVETSADLGRTVHKGTQIRVGTSFVSTVQRQVGPRALEVADVERPGEPESLGEGLTGVLYEKVVKTHVTADNVSIVFNLALLHEKEGHHEAAQELYKAILAEHPTYVHSYLRLGSIARNSGQIHEASKWFKQALDMDPNNPDILSYLGNLHMRNSEWGPAQKKFEKILEMLRGDSYAMLSLGNIYFSNLEDRSKYEKHLQHAANFYQEVIKDDGANAFSANGLGMVLAEKGMLDQARNVFARVREVSAETLGDVWVNLAHVCLAQNKHAEAIKLFQNCLKKFHGGRDTSLLIYLAHAYFDARQYKECMSTLLKALHLSPNNLQLWYNLALTRETFAVTVLQKEQKGEHRTLTEVENAIKDLKGATDLFNWLKDCEPDKSGSAHRRLPYSADKAEKHAKFCYNNIARADQHLSHEKIKAEQEQQRREQHQQAAEEVVQQRRRLEEEEKAKEARAAQEQEERAKAKQASLSRLQETWAQTEKKETASKRGKDRRRAQEEAPLYESDGAEDGEQSAEDDVPAHGGGGDRYGDSAASTPPPPLLPMQTSTNLKDIGLSSSDESDDDTIGGKEPGAGGVGDEASPKRKSSDDEDDHARGSEDGQPPAKAPRLPADDSDEDP